MGFFNFRKEQKKIKDVRLKKFTWNDFEYVFELIADAKKELEFQIVRNEYGYDSFEFSNIEVEVQEENIYFYSKIKDERFSIGRLNNDNSLYEFMEEGPWLGKIEDYFNNLKRKIENKKEVRREELLKEFLSYYQPNFEKIISYSDFYSFGKYLKKRYKKKGYSNRIPLSCGKLKIEDENKYEKYLLEFSTPICILELDIKAGYVYFYSNGNKEKFYNMCKCELNAILYELIRPEWEKYEIIQKREIEEMEKKEKLEKKHRIYHLKTMKKENF